MSRSLIARFPVADRSSERRLKKFFKKLIGKKGIEDALNKLDWLTQEEVNMATTIRMEEKRGWLFCPASVPSLFMSMTAPPASSSSSSDLPNLQAVFDTSRKAYEKKTGKNLLTHPLMAQLQDCNFPADILVVLRSQVASTISVNDKLIKWLDPIVNAISGFSSVISVRLVSPIIQTILPRFKL